MVFYSNLILPTPTLFCVPDMETLAPPHSPRHAVFLLVRYDISKFFKLMFFEIVESHVWFDAGRTLMADGEIRFVVNYFGCRRRKPPKRMHVSAVLPARGDTYSPTWRFHSHVSWPIYDLLGDSSRKDKTVSKGAAKRKIIRKKYSGAEPNVGVACHILYAYALSTVYTGW